MVDNKFLNFLLKDQKFKRTHPGISDGGGTPKKRLKRARTKLADCDSRSFSLPSR